MPLIGLISERYRRNTSGRILGSYYCGIPADKSSARSREPCLTSGNGSKLPDGFAIAGRFMALRREQLLMIDRMSLNLSKIVLHDVEYGRLRAALGKLVKDVRARLVLLIDRNGHPIADAGESDSIDLTTLASLAAASLSATEGLERLVGESHLPGVHHLGARQSVYIADVGRRFSLVVVLADGVPHGTMRLRVHRAGNVIEDIFHELGRRLESLREVAAPKEGEVTPEFSDEDIERLVRQLRPEQP